MCGKRWSFPTRVAALRAMPGIPPTPAGLVPVGVYQCKKCKQWCFTSKPDAKGKNNGTRRR